MPEGENQQPGKSVEFVIVYCQAYAFAFFSASVNPLISALSK